MESSVFSLQFFDRPTSTDFRNRLASYSPNLFQPVHLAHLRLLAFLLFTSFTDDFTGSPVMPREVLAALRGELPRIPTGRFRMQPVLAEFEAVSGLRLRITPARYMEGKATLVDVDLPLDLLDAHRRTLEQGLQEVYLVSGKPFTATARQRERQELRDQRDLYPIDETRPNAEVLRYLRGLPENGYARFEKRLPQARKFVLDTFPSRMPSEQRRRDSVLRVLNALQVHFPPLYKQVENTERLYTVGDALSNLPSAVRSVVLEGTTAYDLNNAQLAIAAQLWEVPDLLRLLHEQGSIWPTLYRDLGLSPEHKPQLKPILYATLYGMEVRHLKALLTQAFGREVRDRYLQGALSAALLDARERRMARMREVGGMTDAFGQFFSCLPSGQNVEMYRPTAPEAQAVVRNLLAREAQSYEFRIMAAAAELAATTDKFRIVLWLHDGIYVRYSDETQRRRWQTRLLEAVNTTLSEVGHLLGYIE